MSHAQASAAMASIALPTSRTSCLHRCSSLLPPRSAQPSLPCVPAIRSKRTLRLSTIQSALAPVPSAPISTSAAPLLQLASVSVAQPVVVKLIAAAVVAAAVVLAWRSFDKGSRAYIDGENSVGQEYDAWTAEGILEYFWGEHIHLGYYSKDEMAAGYLKKDFKKAKEDFVDEMLAWSGAKAPKTVVDVGCGIGGTSRILARKFPNAKVIGITLSPNQQKRATELAAEQGLGNVEFRVMDALNMEFENNTFDLVWACESGEHMPDKRKYVEEMTRVLAPEGQMVIACWCQKEATEFTPQERKDLDFLYEEWAHPYFISIEEFVRNLDGTGVFKDVHSENWVDQTLASWRHSIWVGVFDPWPVVFRPHIWWKTIREIVTLERMHRAFDSGLMTYGMIRGTKAKATPAKQASEAEAVTTPLAA